MRNFITAVVVLVIVAIWATAALRNYDAAKHCEEHDGVPVWRAMRWAGEIVCIPRRSTWYQ